MQTRAGKFITALFAAGLLLGTGAAPAGSAEQTSKNLGTFVGAAGSHALKVTIGDIELLVGGGESRASYNRTRNSPIRINEPTAQANARGIFIPGLADTQVSCAPPKLTDEVTSLATPQALEPLLSAKVGLASCSLAGMSELPVAKHGAGEVVADVNLTETLVDSVPQVNEFLGTLQGQLAPLPQGVRDQANNAIDAIQTKLESEPVLQIRLAPTSGNVTSTKPGISSVAPGSAVVVDVLGGVLQIEIAVAEAAASIADGNPAASADVAFVHVKALNILTPDPNDALIDQRITAPQDLTLLQGTPLETGIATERGETSTSCGGALARYDACATGVADAVALNLLRAPLPTINLELVHTEVLAAGNLKAPAVERNQPVLPKTGASATGAVVGGMALAFGGFTLRRRLRR
jgi:LPXTG-motif cell wall-anchored protein